MRTQVPVFLLVLAMLALALPTLSSASEPIDVYLVGAPPGQVIPSTAAVQARLGQKVQLHAVLRVGRGRSARWYAPAGCCKKGVRVGGRRVSGRKLRALGELGELGFAWSKVEPRLHHKDTPPPNEGNPAYSNCVLFGPRHGKWLGYDSIEYYATSISKARGATLTVDRARPSDPRIARNGGLGTMRYQVTVRRGSETFSSPGVEAQARGGIHPRVMRVSFREGDDLVGYLKSYLGVPNVFGSAGPDRDHQSELYQGVDCADVIMAAARMAGAQVPYSHTAGLYRVAPPVTGLLRVDGDGVKHEEGERAGQKVELVMGRDVRVGDIVLIDYVNFNGSRRKWDHVAVVTGDAGKKGVFDPDDPVMHVAYLVALKEEALRRQAPIVVQILRLGRRYQRQILRKAARSSR